MGLRVKVIYRGHVLRKRKLKDTGWGRERKLRRGTALAGG